MILCQQLTLCSASRIDEKILHIVGEENENKIRHQLVASNKVFKGGHYAILHNAKTSGHLGRERTLHSIRNRFYWPGMTDDVARGCQTCQPCSKKKLKQGPGQGSIFALDK